MVDELQIVFSVLRTYSRQFTRENYLALALLLVTAVRKSELIEAPWKEFDLMNQIWVTPTERTKTKKAIAIPLPWLVSKVCCAPWIEPWPGM